MARVPSRKPRSPAPADIASRLVEWFLTVARDLPWRHTLDPYAVWVSEVMLQQTQVRTVIPYWNRWMHRLPTVADLASAPTPDVLKLWEGLGYYRRARHLQAAAQVIMGNPGERLPGDAEGWLALPGVGRYTAGAIASIAFNQPAPILDGNVARVLSRVLALPGNPKDREVAHSLWAAATALVQAARELSVPASLNHAPRVRLSGSYSALNQSLMELGALVCTPSKPSCVACPIRDLCRAYALGRPTAFPGAKPRPAAVRRTLAAVLWRDGGRWLVRQRAEDDVNANLWEFPSLACGPDEDPRAAMARWLNVESEVLAPVGVIRHSITRHRIVQHLFRLEGRPLRSRPPQPAQWKKTDELDDLPWTAAHRKAFSMATA